MAIVRHTSYEANPWHNYLHGNIFHMKLSPFKIASKYIATMAAGPPAKLSEKWRPSYVHNHESSRRIIHVGPSPPGRPYAGLGKLPPFAEARS